MLPSPRTAEDGFKCYAIHAVRLSNEAEQYLIGARPDSELSVPVVRVGYNNTTWSSDGVFVYKRRDESEARVLVVELKYSAKLCPPPSDNTTAEYAVFKAIVNGYGMAAKQYAETVTGKAVDPSRVTLALPVARASARRATFQRCDL